MRYAGASAGRERATEPPRRVPARRAATAERRHRWLAEHRQLQLGSRPEDRAWRTSARRSPTETGIATALNTVDHNTFQDQITNYLGATPDTVYTWFSGFRMKFFADQGFNIAIDDVWEKVKGNYTEGFANSVVGNDGKVYGIPVDYYPWAVFYRKSVFTEKGYTVPTTWDELIALCKKMETDGLTPIAFGDKDGWPARARSTSSTCGSTATTSTST